jgi:modulator of FtsH protease HflK
MKIFTNQGPWGQFGGGGNNNGGSGGGRPPFRSPDNNTPDMDKIINDIKNALKKQFGSGQSGDNKSKIAIAVIVFIILWLSSGIFKVDTGEQGVVMRFGAFNRTAAEGLNSFTWPD